MTPATVTRAQILALRLQRHNLARRLVGGSLEEAAAVCGIQNSPPGSALLSLHARVEEVSGAALDRALLADKRLVQVWSVRTAPLLVPARDAAIFTHGLLPDGEEELRFFIRGASDHLQRFGITATELVDWTALALDQVLDGCELTKDELGVALSRRVEQRIPVHLVDLWNSPDVLGHYGESLVRYALYVVALRGAFCVVSHQGHAATFVRTDQWLGQAFASFSGSEAAELLRRYLAAYGPTTVEHFAQWAGIAPAQAQRSWHMLKQEAAAVAYAGKTQWVRSIDLAALLEYSLPEGVRLLPPHDPYLAARDRTLLVPEKRRHAQIWRAAGGPGVVLDGGEIVATWRARKKGTTLQIAIEDIDAPRSLRTAIDAEANAVARLRGCRRADVAFGA
jgi:hypothetical protein